MTLCKIINFICQGFFFKPLMIHCIWIMGLLKSLQAECVIVRKASKFICQQSYSPQTEKKNNNNNSIPFESIMKTLMLNNTARNLNIAAMMFSNKSEKWKQKHTRTFALPKSQSLTWWVRGSTCRAYKIGETSSPCD